MKVKLINKPTLLHSDWAIGMCYDKGSYTDPEKISNRINKVANVNKHSSTIEFINYVFEITASTKVLLEMTRHRHANYACKSSRYTLNKSELVFEPTGDSDVDFMLSAWKLSIEDMIENGKKNDIVSLMLPQAYQYKWIVQFNARSLQNFFHLRLDKHAHFQIREVAQAMFKTIPKDHQFLFQNKNIKE
jgi:thymidylate synthase (FAD)